MDSNKMLNLWVENADSIKRGGILSTNGRVLLAIIYEREITQLAISLILGLSEAAIEKSVAFWLNAGIIEVNKVGRKNVYSTNWVKLREHPDYAVIKGFIEDDNQIQLEITQSSESGKGIQ